MCLFLFTLFAGPRTAIVIWWLIAPRRWDEAFPSLVLPVLGFIFLPWTTLAFVLVSTGGRVVDLDWIWVALAFLIDLLSTGFGRLGSRQRFGYR